MIKFLKKVFDLIFILIIIILCAYFVLRYTNQLMIYRVKTGSMENNIHVDDYILIVKQDDYEIGDVVTFEKGAGFITHRIIKKDGDSIITKGDANNVEDDIIDKNSIVGKVIISGGIINIIINYKYALIGFLLSLYLFSCYLSDDDKHDDAEDTDAEQNDAGEENATDETNVENDENALDNAVVVEEVKETETDDSTEDNAESAAIAENTEESDSTGDTPNHENIENNENDDTSQDTTAEDTVEEKNVKNKKKKKSSTTKKKDK